jgi:hypothetical protein
MAAVFFQSSATFSGAILCEWDGGELDDTLGCCACDCVGGDVRVRTEVEEERAKLSAREIDELPSHGLGLCEHGLVRDQQCSRFNDVLQLIPAVVPMERE